MAETIDKYSFKVSLGSHDSRLKKPPAKEVVDYLYSRWLAATLPSFEEMTRFLKAHMVELHDKGIVPKKEVVDILKTLSWIETEGLTHFQLDPSIEDLMPNLEAILISKLGESVGGKVLTGMARGEPMYVSAMLLLQKKMIEILEELHGLRNQLLDLASQHTMTLMPGYTHVQHAQPTTLGHYLDCVAEALEYDSIRLNNAYRQVNTSPAGYSSAWGTSYPTDRRRIADLIGFEKVIENTRYAMLSFDRGIETLAALSILAININRFTDDLYFWCTFEFNMADIGDEYASTSYIMPQKKNPYALEEYPALSNRVLSEFTRVAQLTRLISFGLATHLSGKRTDTTMTPTRVIDDIKGAIRMLRGILSSMKFNEDVMRERTSVNFTQGTDLADMLVREKGLSFRTAHRIIGALVRDAIHERKRPHQLTVEMLDKAAIEVTGKGLNVDRDNLNRALNSMEGVNSRQGIGGVSPKSVEKSIQNRRIALGKDMEELEIKRQNIVTAHEKLKKEIERICH